MARSWWYVFWRQIPQIWSMWTPWATPQGTLSPRQLSVAVKGPLRVLPVFLSIERLMLSIRWYSWVSGRGTWTSKIPNIMDPILAVLSILECGAIILCTLEVQVVGGGPAGGPEPNQG